MRRLMYCILVVALGMFSACGVAAPAPTSKPARPPLRVSWILWPGWYPIILAQEKGFFANHGVQVDAKLYERYSDIPADFAANKLDGTFIGLYDILPLADVNQARVVLVTDNSDGAEGLIAVNSIRTPQDLKGKRIGVVAGSIGEFFVRTLLQSNNIDVADVQFVALDPEAVPAGIPATIDAGYTWEPHITQAASQRNTVVASTADLPGLVPDVLMFRDTIVNERPDDVRGFVAAWFDAITYWQQNLAEGNALIAKATGLNPADISTQGVKLFTQIDNVKAFTPGDSPLSLQYTANVQLQFLKTTGTLRTEPNLNTLLDGSFIK